MTLPNPGSINRADLPGLDCGMCGMRSCDEMVARAPANPDIVKRCIYLSANRFEASQKAMANMAMNTPARVPGPFAASAPSPAPAAAVASCAGCATSTAMPCGNGFESSGAWRDTLGREFDFYLEHFPEDPGPREIIIPHNPMITREMNIQPGDTLIGRPLGMSCGCPITHCGVAMQVDARTGVIVWCVTGPLNPRASGFKDLGYYIAEGYEGLITEARTEIRIGMRYYFQPRMCMLQWRHSGLVNFMNQTQTGLQVRVEGLWIG